MNREEYRQFHEDCTERMKATVQAKQADYCGGSDSPFANFEKVERDNLCTTEVGMMVRISDKISRIQSFINLGALKVADETVEDTCLDAANYLILLAARFKSRKEEVAKHVPIEPLPIPNLPLPGSFGIREF